MTSFRFLQCADLHIDSPLRGLEADPDAPAETIRGATREALRRMIDFVLDERLDFVVAAGDLYDGDWQDWRTGHFLVGQIARLTQAGIPFVAIRGNHDADSVITRNLRFPEGAALLDHRKPQSVRLPNLPVSIHGQSFSGRAVTENLAASYPPPEPDRFNIGLLHTALDGRRGHDPYAPASVEQLRAHGYDYWALGHVHNREILSQDPWIVFPGNTQGRHANETGSKGATLVQVTGGAVTDVDHRSFDVVRWARVPVALPLHADEDLALSLTRDALAVAVEQAEGRLLACRVVLSGACEAHAALARDLGAAREKIRAEATGQAGPVWVESVDLATRPPPAQYNERTGAIGQLLHAIDQASGSDIAEDLRSHAEALVERARFALTPGHLASRCAQGETDEELVNRAKDLLRGILAAS